MNIHEYQGKSILKSYGVAVPEGYMAESPEDAVDSAIKIKEATNTDSWAIKAQIRSENCTLTERSEKICRHYPWNEPYY